MCVRVRALPEVGDLLLSMSTDCWLSDSSVRPDGGDQRGEGQQQAPSQISSSSFVVSVVNTLQRSAQLLSASRNSKEEVSVRTIAWSHLSEAYNNSIFA